MIIMILLGLNGVKYLLEFKRGFDFRDKETER